MSVTSFPIAAKSRRPRQAASPARLRPLQIDASCRLPLVVLFLSAAVWLVIGSAFALIASIKFHAPGFLADSAWLTYGRVRPAGLNCLLYGFCLQAGLGVALWMLARLGRTTLASAGAGHRRRPVLEPGRDRRRAGDSSGRQHRV